MSARLLLTFACLVVVVAIFAFGVLIVLEPVHHIDLTSKFPALQGYVVDLSKNTVKSGDQPLLYLAVIVLAIALIFNITDLKRLGFLAAAGLALGTFGFLIPDPTIKIIALWSSGLLKVKFRQAGQTAFIQIGLGLVALALFLIGFFGAGADARNALINVQKLYGPLIILGYFWTIAVDVFNLVGEGMDGVPSATHRMCYAFICVVLGANPWLGIKGEIIPVLQLNKLVDGGFSNSLWNSIYFHVDVLLAVALVVDDFIETKWFQFWQILELVFVEAAAFLFGEVKRFQPIIVFVLGMIIFTGAATGLTDARGVRGELFKSAWQWTGEWFGDIRELFGGRLKIPVNAILNCLLIAMGLALVERAAITLMFLSGK